MPQFANAFSGMASEKILSDAELIRAIRFMIASEYEAIQLYMQLAESIDNEIVKQALEEISNEERKHVGQFLRLLYDLAPEEQDYYEQGDEEVNNIIDENT